MDSSLALIAALTATGFGIELWVNHQRRPRPHIAAYAIGMTMFALATWALFYGLAFGWTGFAYRTFFLFGAVLNILFLALGSMFLVGGRKAGHVMALALGALTAISTTLATTVPFIHDLPEGGIPETMFESGFGPRLFAIIGGAAGTTILVVLALLSVVRFWKSQRNIVWGNLLIVAGTVAAASGGTGLALGAGGAFAVSLFVSVALIWAGYRLASGERQKGQDQKANGEHRMDHPEAERI